MKKELGIGLGILLIANLAGCQENSTAKNVDSQKQFQSKVLAKNRSESKLKTEVQSKSVCESKEKANAESKSKNDADVNVKTEENPKTNSDQVATDSYSTQLVPDDLQGTWYSSDDNSSSPIVFTPNEMKIGSSVTEIHGSNEMTDQDKRVINNNDISAMNDARENWLLANMVTDTDGNTWLNLRGWYQNAGAGSFYKVTIKQVEGQAIKVMTSAHGGGMWSDGHYYISQALADVNKNKTYQDDHLN
ncbi:hypothetical protein [Lacticaseibacillus paracasei]|uniref:hypothetical protein n=1 Tax=Lacticaseibacillus paracasei TaxID=1597 RepID=UPI0031DBAFD0